MILALALSTGCVHEVNLRVLEPADVALPSDVQRIAVLNRSRPKNVGQGVLDTLEGAATGEAPGMDRQGSDAAVRGMVELLQESPRFDAVMPLLDRDQLASDIFDKELRAGQVRRICRQHGCDALVSLDAFDSDTIVGFDSHTVTETDSQGREVNVLMHDAVRDTSVLSSWRTYYVRENSILDEVRGVRNARSWSGEGRTRAAALATLADPYDTARAVGWDAGYQYARRIAPLYTIVERSYYGGGDARLKEAKRHVKADDWEGAAGIWEGMLEDEDRKMRGKARYNMAVFHEVRGELYPARRVAKRAAVELGNGRSRNYVYALERRLADRKELNRQMTPDTPDPIPVHPAERDDVPLAVPAPMPAPPPNSDSGGRLERPQ